MKDCIFCKIANHTIPKDFLYEDENIVVFSDIHPVKPIHVLIVPKQHIKDFMDLEDDDLSAAVNVAIQKMIQEHNLTQKGYRVVVNGGGAQVIDHLHFHLLGPLGKEVAL